MIIIKRSKKAEEFDKNKLLNSIKKSFESCNDSISTTELESIYNSLELRDGMRTEEIQRQLENALMKLGYYNQARFFIIWRHINYYDNYLGNKVKFMRNYLSAKNAATGSQFDPNSNVTEKNLVTLSGELWKGDIIKLNRYRMYSKIQELYGTSLADDYINLIENHVLYKNDESNILPYCVAISCYPYLTDGLSKLGGLSTPPKNLDSFCGSFPNLCFAIAAHFAGALATPEFLPYFDYFARLDLGQDYMDKLDSFYMIGPKLRYLLDKSGKWFHNIHDLSRHDFEDEELNTLKSTLVKDCNRYLNDEELAEWRDNKLKGDINFETKISDGSRTVRGYLIQKFQQLVYTLNQPGGARLYQSIFWNIGYFDEGYFKGLFEDFRFPDGTPMVWESLSKLQKFFMKFFNKERTKNVLTFPVESFSLLVDKDTNKFLDKDSIDFVSEMYAEGHSFFTYISDNPDALSSCCRLRNEVTENQFSYTLGMSGVMTGSKSVLTMNINRAVQVAINNKINYLDYIRDLVKKMQKFQIAFNELLYEFKDEGALQVYDAGFISLEKQYLTLGINGMIEAAEFLGIEPRVNNKYKEFVDSILTIFHDENKNARSKKLLFNTEFIPAESVGPKNYKWDKRDGYIVPSGRNCYNSYFFASEDDSLSVIDKLKLHGREFVSKLDGGSACHINLSEHLSKEQYKKVLEIAASEGTNYLTFNIPNTICNDCGHIDKRYLTKCPKCHSTNIDYATRVIGYLKRISNFSEPRQVESSKRVYLGQDRIE